MIFSMVFSKNHHYMKTLKLAIFIALIAVVISCRKKPVTDVHEKDVPGVGMAHDSANQKLDSSIKAMDTTTIEPR
jgi:hypothetical protein